jgi:hypothetical protein
VVKVKRVLPRYHDIKDRISELPVWYDAHGCPRYGDFEPNVLGVYDDIALLYLIECQSCQARFKVGEGHNMHSSFNGYIKRAGLAYLDYQDKVKKGEPAELPDIPWEKPTLAQYAACPIYGDPPIHGCVGDTMSSSTLKVLEAWEKEKASYNWVRVFELEINIEPGW